MIDPCRYCDSQYVAAVLDKKIEARPTAGNKYRTRCLDCGRWLPMCGAADFQAADHQHVLPRDADPEADDPTVPVAEYDGDVEGIKTADSGDSQPEMVTDGGQPVEGDQDDQDDQETNQFDCPGCGERVEGYPDECPHCGVAYNWESDSDS